MRRCIRTCHAGLLQILLQRYKIHLSSFVHFQNIQGDIHIHVIQGCFCMWHLRDRSDFLYTHQYLRNRRLYFIVFASNNLFLLKLLCLMLRVHWYSMEAIIGLLFTHSIVNSSNIPLVFLGEKELNIVPRHVCNYFTWARMSIPSKSFFAGAIIKPNSIGALCIFVTNIIAAFAFIDV